jgi:hypothetical protein
MNIITKLCDDMKLCMHAAMLTKSIRPRSCFSLLEGQPDLSL